MKGEFCRLVPYEEHFWGSVVSNKKVEALPLWQYVNIVEEDMKGCPGYIILWSSWHQTVVQAFDNSTHC